MVSIENVQIITNITSNFKITITLSAIFKPFTYLLKIKGAMCKNLPIAALAS